MTRKSINRIILVEITILLFLFGIITVCSGQEYSDDKALFNAIDFISNGKIDRGEFDIFHHSSFLEIDRNHDQVVSTDECLENCFVHEKVKYPEFSTTLYNFESIDLDGSGIINLYEYVLFGRDTFASIDVNADSFLENDEFSHQTNFFKTHQITEKNEDK